MNNETKNRKAFLEMRLIELNTSTNVYEKLKKEFDDKLLFNKTAKSMVRFELATIKDLETLETI